MNAKVKMESGGNCSAGDTTGTSWHCSSLEFRLQAASANTRDWPPIGGTPNLNCQWVKNNVNIRPDRTHFFAISLIL